MLEQKEAGLLLPTPAAAALKHRTASGQTNQLLTLGLSNNCTVCNKRTGKVITICKSGSDLSLLVQQQNIHIWANTEL